MLIYFDSLFYTLFCIISHRSKICFARRVFISEFSCENRKINCAVLSFMFLKPGRTMLILWNNSIQVLYSRHVVIKCSSFSTVCKHVGHFRSSLGIMGLFSLPSSIISLWSDILNFVKAILCFLFLT